MAVVTEQTGLTGGQHRIRCSRHSRPSYHRLALINGTELKCNKSIEKFLPGRQPRGDGMWAVIKRDISLAAGAAARQSIPIPVTADSRSRPALYFYSGNDPTDRGAAAYAGTHRSPGYSDQPTSVNNHHKFCWHEKDWNTTL